MAVGPSPRNRLTVVIPHRSRADLLARALAACEGWRVLVVDDTPDGLDLDVPRLRLGTGSGWPGSGFARAVNAGLAEVRTPNAVLLNDDAAPLPGCLDALAARGGLCGPVLVDATGAVESAGIDVRAWGRVVARRSVPAADRRDALSGACLHLPAHLRLDERYAHGFEDVELCRRAGPAWLVAEARCVHAGGATVPRDSAQAQRHALAGQLRLVGPGWRRGVVLSLHLAQILREEAPRLGLARAHARGRGLIEGWSDAHPRARAPRTG